MAEKDTHTQAKHTQDCGAPHWSGELRGGGVVGVHSTGPEKLLGIQAIN